MTDKTYILELKDGGFRKVTVPDTWKVTFGPLSPGARGESHLALRFYEGKELQRAIFTDVKTFRDASIPISEKVTRSKVMRDRKDAPGGSKDIIYEARVTEWRDPDGEEKPTDSFLQLPAEFTEDFDKIGQE